jgi:3'-phosphoadenosine 5'-phosphosulfate synthase
MVDAAGSHSQTHKSLSGATYWFTGLSGAGKSTLSEALKKNIDKITGDSGKCFILDGDVIRTGLNKGLGFSEADRQENIRRIAEVSKLFNMAGVIVFVAFISPYAQHRDAAKAAHAESGLKFFECHISADLATCEARDVKGLYKKARAGEIKNFTGISDPYEAPANCDLNVNTGAMTLDQSVAFVLKHMEEQKVLAKKAEPMIYESLIKEASAEEAEAAKAMKSINLSLIQVQYLQTISEGWAYPLTGFMNELQLVESMHMKTVTDKNGKAHLLSVPITQHVTSEEKAALEGQAAVALKYNDKVVAVMHKPTFFANRKEEICTRTFGTFSAKHPAAAVIMEQGDWLMSSESTRFFERIRYDDGIDKYRFTPREIYEQIQARGADAVYGFQVRNPLHNGHVLLLKDTREQLIKAGYKNPILLLHPLGGWCKDDDVPLGPRMNQHQALIDDGTLPAEHIILAVWPSPMYYGGPTEVLWHASSRVGCGLSHFITGRDPAGVKHPEQDKDLYDPWHGQKLLVHMKGMLNGVDVLPFKVAAYNGASAKMEFFNPQAPNAKDFQFISGSKMRAMAKAGESLPPGFMSEKGWEVLSAYYKSL